MQRAAEGGNRGRGSQRNTTDQRVVPAPWHRRDAVLRLAETVPRGIRPVAHRRAAHRASPSAPHPNAAAVTRLSSSRKGLTTRVFGVFRAMRTLSRSSSRVPPDHRCRNPRPLAAVAGPRIRAHGTARTHARTGTHNDFRKLTSVERYSSNAAGDNTVRFNVR